MKIGLDVSAVQSAHRMRGIGSTTINFLKNLSAEDKKMHEFILFLHENGREEALLALGIEKNDFELRTIKDKRIVKLKLPGRLKIINSIINIISGYVEEKVGNNRIKDISDLDVFLQFDQMEPLPRNPKVRMAIILYDLIPYIMESDYLWSYKTALKNGLSRKSALKKSFLRKRYIGQIRSNTKRADILLAISKSTKNDFVSYVGVSAEKINITHLGVTTLSNEKLSKHIKFQHYIKNSWGLFPHDINLNDKPFLLFIGGADPRRRLEDLVAAYNNLKAQGYDMRLVMAGDTMRSPDSIPNAKSRNYIERSSYYNDIVFLGFVSNDQREWLYKNTISLVYPSVYEGFGLPILEAMQYGTPVITYKNSSIMEITGDLAFYASDAISIKQNVEKIINNPGFRNEYGSALIDQASKYSWKNTVSKVLKNLSN